MEKWQGVRSRKWAGIVTPLALSVGDYELAVAGVLSPGAMLLSDGLVQVAGHTGFSTLPLCPGI